MAYLKKAPKKFEEVQSLFQEIQKKVASGELTGNPVELQAKVVGFLNDNSAALERNLRRFVTVDDEMNQLKSHLRLLYKRPEPVLITGPTGTGKEILARALTKDGHPFVGENCAAIPENLIESIFFGHIKGAFTGAHCDHMGILEAAGDGVVFLDEIGDAPLHLQAKLLRAIQEQEIRRVGDTELLEINCRFIAATKYNLVERVEQRLFREDLYARLMAFELHVTPLMERPHDIAAITESMMPSKDAFEKLPKFPPSIMKLIETCNVRGIESALARYRAWGHYEYRKYEETKTTTTTNL